MADLLAPDKYQDETASTPDNCASTIGDDIDHKNLLPTKYAENPDSNVDGEETESCKENQNLRDAKLDHESSAAPNSNCKPDQRGEIETVKNAFLSNGIEVELELAESSNNNVNHDSNSIRNDAILTDYSEKSCLEDDLILHNNNTHRTNGSATESGGQRHILDVKHLNDSGIDITDIETEKIMENHLHSSTTHDKKEVIYDETAPKRINRPSRLKIKSPEDESTLLMDGIDKLISPDDKGAGKSPTRMRRSGSVETPQYKTVSKARAIIVYNEPEEYEHSQTNTKHFEQNQKSEHRSELPQPHNHQHRSESLPQKYIYDPNRLLVDQIEQHHLYKKSPDMHRKFFSTALEPTKRSESPVLRMKNRSESSPSTYRKYGRKISSDARLCGGAPDAHSKQQPVRKISSNARIEHVKESFDNIPEEEPKCRRVSFGTATYIKHGHKVNIEKGLEKLRHNSSEQTEVHKNESNERNIGNKEFRNGDVRMQASPNNRVTKDTTQNNVIKPTAAGFNNKAYIEDEKTAYPKQAMKIIDSQTGTSMNVRENIYSTIKKSTSSESLISFEATKSMDTKSLGQNHREKKEKKLSTHSLPDVSRNEHTKKKARHSVGITGSPRSILKVKTDDTVSNGSTNSINGTRLKIKRDSVALYHEQHDDVEKQNRGNWVGISRKDFKRVMRNKVSHIII